MTFRYFLLEDTVADEKITITVNSIRNPLDYTTPTETIFKVTDGNETDGNEGEVADGSYDDWSNGRDLFTYSYIKTFFVTPYDKTAGKSPVTYKMTIVPFTKVAAEAIIVIDLPPELEIASSQQLTRQCPKASINGFSNPTINCQYNSGKQTITITKGFKGSDSLLNPPTLTFDIS